MTNKSFFVLDYNFASIKWSYGEGKGVNITLYGALASLPLAQWYMHLLCLRFRVRFQNRTNSLHDIQIFVFDFECFFCIIFKYLNKCIYTRCLDPLLETWGARGTRWCCALQVWNIDYYLFIKCGLGKAEILN